MQPHRANPPSRQGPPFNVEIDGLQRPRLLPASTTTASPDHHACLDPSLPSSSAGISGDHFE